MMYFYFYKAFTARGKQRVGFLFASDLKNLKYILSLRGLRLRSARTFPVWLRFILLRLFKIRKKYRVGAHSRGIFFRQIANLLESGLTIQKSIESMIAQESNVFFLQGLCVLHKNLILGGNLASSIQEAFSFLPNEYRFLMSGCKDTQSVRDVLLAIATVSEKKQTLLFSIIRMCVVFLFSLGLTVFIFAFYVRIWLFDDRMNFYYNRTFPPYLYETFYQIFSGKAFLNWRYILFALIVAAIIILIRSTPKILLYWKKFVLHLPIIGEGIRAQVASSLFFYLELQVMAGTTLQAALRVGATMMRHSPYHAELQKLSDDLARGRSMKDALSDMRVFSADEKSLLISSLSGGALQESLQVIRRYLDNKMQTRMLVVRETVRFSLILFLLLLYAWALYTRFYRETGYAFGF